MTFGLSDYDAHPTVCRLSSVGVLIRAFAPPSKAPDSFSAWTCVVLLRAILIEEKTKSTTQACLRLFFLTDLGPVSFGEEGPIGHEGDGTVDGRFTFRGVADRVTLGKHHFALEIETVMDETRVS